jgi:RNA polymerase sigma factor (sigma-70 family)
LDDQRIEGILVQLAEERSDEAAWTDLYTRLRPFVYTLAYRRTNGSHEMARDAAQEVFLRLVKYCPFERMATAGEFRAYLSVVTRNVVSVLHQRQQISAPEADDPRFQALELSEPLLTPHGEVIELRQLLLRALLELPEEERRMLSLWVRGNSPQEIAAEFGITPGNAAVRLHRIRARLRRNALLRDLL